MYFFYFVLSACTSGRRYGDHCFDSVDEGSLAINLDSCKKKFGVLWRPETTAEIAFVQEMFPASFYHLGIRSFDGKRGMRHADNSFGPGVPFLTREWGKKM